jgi:hypothetical protein
MAVAKTAQPAQQQAAQTDAPKNKGGRQKPPEGETKNGAFKRMANVRVGKVLEALRVLDNTFTPTNYEWTAEQAAVIFDAIEDSLSKIKDRAAGKIRSKSKFSLD